MTKSYKFDDTENILFCIDKSIKKVREIEKRKFPYAILINKKNGQMINIESFTCLSKNGFKTIPIVEYPEIKEKEIKLTFMEQELLELIAKTKT
nr:MAG TPA: hypothetical protein [Caudoviricetes sp.]